MLMLVLLLDERQKNKELRVGDEKVQTLTEVMRGAINEK